MNTPIKNPKCNLTRQARSRLDVSKTSKGQCE